VLFFTIVTLPSAMLSDAIIPDVHRMAS